MSQFYFGKTPHRVIYTNSEKESKEYISVLECSKELKIRRATVIDCCVSSSYGRTITKGKHKGKHFKYKYPSNSIKIQKKTLWPRYLEWKENKLFVGPTPGGSGPTVETETVLDLSWIDEMQEKMNSI